MASTTWFYCGHCGFKNHPRPNAPGSYVPSESAPGKFEYVPGDTLCEQCGAPNSSPASHDYTPGGA